MVIYCVIWHVRIERSPKGMEKAATMVIISVHLTMTYRDNPRWDVFKHFSGCLPRFCSST